MTMARRTRTRGASSLLARARRCAMVCSGNHRTNQREGSFPPLHGIPFQSDHGVVTVHMFPSPCDVDRALQPKGISLSFWMVLLGVMVCF